MASIHSCKVGTGISAGNKPARGLLTDPSSWSTSANLDMPARVPVPVFSSSDIFT
eukprot:CAMPEP_0169172630 /NCGR_PEP_ID=MMETSP1015-20121227/63472_1 /TAXON_ID=342587 /ORGANISM="Karlodinium micrum, Strain CCMP2283" /LENGTH=54 /DNA_ID=CAMNT_0009246149 /DNA_START=99 /DNA_END=259 /DNA_ORIENTATION=+